MTITQIYCVNQLTNEGKVLSNFQHWEYKFAFDRAERTKMLGYFYHLKRQLFLLVDEVFC